MLERIGDSSEFDQMGYIKEICLDPGHDPPKHIVLEPGIYKHTCPNCGHSITFKVPLITC